ncbi:hypothetical protein P280DRAFT_467982 [Massarina eburnea CBS 473.64]|uniref:Uncharacterized protein n=1 Tax=Massarina eburnea CBS 473.64 TaxID=1395130 RepID=A0A6A6S5Y0_9PLEO|nr:hypothetical protein P280DRAFT_467982 [Massarina eburnea CBS 473.64]
MCPWAHPSYPHVAEKRHPLALLMSSTSRALGSAAVTLSDCLQGYLHSSPDPYPHKTVQPVLRNLDSFGAAVLWTFCSNFSAIS